jgi:hypothetical protein
VATAAAYSHFFSLADVQSNYLSVEEIMTPEERFTKLANSQLAGRRIVSARYLTTKEAIDQHWTKRCIVLELDDGNLVFPTVDEEGNNAGVLVTSHSSDPILPTLNR